MKEIHKSQATLFSEGAEIIKHDLNYFSDRLDKMTLRDRKEHIQKKISELKSFMKKVAEHKEEHMDVLKKAESAYPDILKGRLSAEEMVESMSLQLIPEYDPNAVVLEYVNPTSPPKTSLRSRLVEENSKSDEEPSSYKRKIRKRPVSMMTSDDEESKDESYPRLFRSRNYQESSRPSGPQNSSKTILIDPQPLKQKHSRIISSVGASERLDGHRRLKFVATKSFQRSSSSNTVSRPSDPTQKRLQATKGAQRFSSREVNKER